MAADINDGKIFGGSGLDQDSDLLAIQGGDSRYRLNVILSEDTNYQVLSNLKGNLERVYSLPSGTSLVKGFVEDKENKAGIYFIQNAINNHSIVRYNSEDDSFTTIFSSQEAILPDWSLRDEFFVDASIIGNEDEQFLIWTDGREPHMINIKFAIDGNYSNPVTEEEISFYKRPLQVSFRSLTVGPFFSGDINPKLEGKVFQFAVRYKYFDKTFTTLSEFSELAIYEDNLASGRVSFEESRISVFFTPTNSPAIVDKYQLLYRIIDIGDAVPGTWFIYDEYNYTDSPQNISFFNDKSIGTVSDEEALRPFDFVPDKANHVGVIDDNRAVFDVGQEGFDNIELNVTPEVDIVDILSSDEGVRETDDSGIFNTSYTATWSEFENYDHNVKISVGRAVFSPYTLETGGLTATEVGQDIKDYFDSLSIADLTITNNSGGNTVDLLFTTSTDTRVRFIVLKRSATFPTIKTSASYKFGIQYGYSGKLGTVQTNDQCIFNPDDLNYQFSDIPGAYTNYWLRAKLTIDHDPPEGATDFRIVSFGSDVDFFEEYLVYMNLSDLTDDSSELTMYLEEPYTIIRRDDIVNRMRKAYGDETSGIEYGFDFQKGDVVRFVGYYREITSLNEVDKYDVRVVDTDLEYVIDVVTSTEIKLSSAAIRNVALNSPTSTDNFWLIQIIRKKENFNEIAETFSPMWPISDHGTIFVSSTIDITQYFADTWKSKQVYISLNNREDYFGPTEDDTGYYCWMEKNRISLYYDSRPTNQGKFSVVNEFAEQRGDRKIRWGGKFLDEANVNFLTTFEFDDTRDVDDRNGTIQKIQQIGDVLKVYQQRKVTSFYLKTTSSIDSDGNSTFVFSDEVMSVGRQSNDDHGCTNFSSYIKNVRHAYFFDLVNASVVRDSPNGLQAVSDYGMHSYFKQKTRDILEFQFPENIQVLGGWDEDQEMYIISFVYIRNGVIQESEINETLGFHEPTNRWMSFFSYIPEYYGKISGDQLLTFRAGKLYEHNVNPARNNFYSDQNNSEVYIHSNQQPALNKVYNSIEVTSIGQWFCPDNDSIVIERPIGMQSRLVLGKWKKQEGVYRSNFMRDMLNGGSTPTRVNLANGRQLRGQEMTVKLVNEDLDQALLESVLIQANISK